MNVVLLKKYLGHDWVRIAAHNKTLWSAEDVWALYLAFFG